jgi:hypothetical protein
MAGSSGIFAQRRLWAPVKCLLRNASCSAPGSLCRNVWLHTQVQVLGEKDQVCGPSRPGGGVRLGLPQENGVWGYTLLIN